MTARATAWVQTADGRWLHRPWPKVLINGVLRFCQRGPVKWVIITYCDDTPDGSEHPPKVLGYGFRTIYDTSPRSK